MVSNPPIRSFTGKFRFLSNFYDSPIIIQGCVYPTAEHAYQASKMRSLEDHEFVLRSKTPGDAKRRARKLPMRSGFEDEKVSTMRQILKEKFSQHSLLRDKLLATGQRELIEGNYWRDTFWGVDLRTGFGENHLGKLLMEIRDATID